MHTPIHLEVFRPSQTALASWQCGKRHLEKETRLFTLCHILIFLLFSFLFFLRTGINQSFHYDVLFSEPTPFMGKDCETNLLHW